MVVPVGVDIGVEPAPMTKKSNDITSSPPQTYNTIMLT